MTAQYCTNSWNVLSTSTTALNIHEEGYHRIDESKGRPAKWPTALKYQKQLGPNLLSLLCSAGLWKFSQKLEGQVTWSKAVAGSTGPRSPWLHFQNCCKCELPHFPTYHVALQKWQWQTSPFTHDFPWCSHQNLPLIWVLSTVTFDYWRVTCLYICCFHLQDDYSHPFNTPQAPTRDPKTKNLVDLIHKRKGTFTLGPVPSNPNQSSMIASSSSTLEIRYGTMEPHFAWVWKTGSSGKCVPPCATFLPHHLQPMQQAVTETANFNR